VLQLVALQPEQELPVPAIGADSPLLPLEKEAKREKTRLEGRLQRVQAASPSALLMGRSSSNLHSHWGQ